MTIAQNIKIKIFHPWCSNFSILLIKRWSEAESFIIFENHVYTSKKILCLHKICWNFAPFSGGFFLMLHRQKFAQNFMHFYTIFGKIFFPLWTLPAIFGRIFVLRLSLKEIHTHCYFSRLNLKKMGPLQFCLPVFLGIHRNPKQKEIFNSCEGFLK